MDSNSIISRIVEVLNDKKAVDVSVIDINKVSSIADCFIICSGTSVTHIKTLSDELTDILEKEGIECSHKEGYNSARWILLDFGEVVVHIFHQEDREFYNLEKLWRNEQSRNF